ncbi:MAG: hypothetical protein HY287_02315 [Planctomycetes bacterium]|nr:hypothetical protein [Planctomycetota bacterium]MBI3833143.1 hypothetical protein [Planctomycetota bacterium]
MDELCVAFADGQALAMSGVGESVERSDNLAAFMEMARKTLGRVSNGHPNGPVFQRNRLQLGSAWATPGALHAALRETHPISVEAGFEGNPGVEGGEWRAADGGDDGLVHLRFLAGTEDLPLHIHEFSDRLIVVTSGMGLFHYMPDRSETRELRSIVVEPGDVLIFTRGLIHTFTAPISELTLLSYHSPFFELDDPRQFTIPKALRQREFEWAPSGVVRFRGENVLAVARMNDFAAAVR